MRGLILVAIAGLLSAVVGHVRGMISVFLALGVATSAIGLDCAGWNTKQFFSSATAEDVATCLEAGASPRSSRSGFAALTHREQSIDHRQQIFYI